MANPKLTEEQLKDLNQKLPAFREAMNKLMADHGLSHLMVKSMQVLVKKSSDKMLARAEEPPCECRPKCDPGFTCQWSSSGSGKIDCHCVSIG